MGKRIHAAAKQGKIIALSAPVEITAGEKDGDKQGPAKFNVVAYTGQAMRLNGWEYPVVVDIEGMEFSDTLTANLDHDTTKRVGHVTEANKHDGKVLLAGVASAVSPSKEEVVASGAAGYPWKASIEADPLEIQEVGKGKTLKANGQEFKGPLFYIRKSLLSGFGFVTRGADSKTAVTIAAQAASNRSTSMKPEVKAWAESMGIDVENATDELKATIEANYSGRQPEKPKKPKVGDLDKGIQAKEAEKDRIEGITEIALNACDKRPYDITAIRELAERAIEAKWDIDKFRLELLEASLPPAHTVFRTKRDDRVNNRVLEAALAQVGRLPNLENYYDDQTLQAAHDRFKGRIGLKQLFLLCAQSNGYHEHNMEVTLDVQRAAFGMRGPQQIQAQGWSTIDIATIISNTANKFIMRGWNMVDQTALRIAKIQNVRDFKTATTVSLTDSVRYEKLGAAGEIKHGTLGELSYTVKADTYAKMLAITRQDIINDDVGALTDVPMKLGNGAIKILNHIFWTEFLGLVSANFFGSGNNNINTGVADMTVGGLDATETIFMNQTNPDGTPLGIQPAILLVPTALKNKALTLMGSMLNAAAITSYAAATGDKNPFVGRFRVESSPYISNSSYTGNTSSAWWMLADPNELPVIAIAALNGRVEPTVETADADFNVLGVQMRGYSDVGVNEQEYRGGVHADGGSS